MTIVRNARSHPVRWTVPDSPFEAFERLFEDFGSVGARAETAGYPMDLFETDEHIVLQLAVPGLQADDLDISIEGRQLTVRATLPTPNADEGRRYWLQTIPRGAFTRTVRLPAGVDTDDVSAHVTHGMLELRMPKAAEAKVRKVAIENR